ncbi:MAG: hypothetical protein NVSMB6_11500 [Burkholderiaceae bacterium]
MFAKSILANAAGSFITGAAFAAENTITLAGPTLTSTVTRASLQQGLYAAQDAGELVSAESYGHALASVLSGVSRDQVRADAVKFVAM